MNRRELNTQKRNRTQTIQIESPMNAQVHMNQRGGSLNIQELYQHYQQKPKGATARVANHQVSNGPPQAMQNNMMSQPGSPHEGAYTIQN